MKRVLGVLCACLLAASAVLAAPAVAAAANAYGLVFAGQAKCLECHGDVGGLWQVATYPGTAHGQFVVDVKAHPESLVPTSGQKAAWPSASVGGGYSFKPADVWLQLGAPGSTKEYVSAFTNDAAHTLSTGFTLSAIAGPADDHWLFDGPSWLTAENRWDVSAVGSVRNYFQSCGGCHNLGVTRPTDKTYTLASGATVSHSTETSYAGLGIQCESCHGTGAADASGGHHTTGVDIVRSKQVLKSQVCGQCHVAGTAKERNYTGGTFSGPNGYTADKNLTDFFNVLDIQYARTSPASGPVSIPSSDTKFYPDGHNKANNHVYYNEWLFSGHANSMRYPDGELWSSHAKDSCLTCHSGEGFLKRIGYGANEPNDISTQPSNLASDTLNVECGICHVVHSTSTTDALGLRLPKGELCQACHNGGIAAGQEATAGATPHHPQAEMLAGYGLIGVERPVKPFMTNADCIDCHMPMTRAGRVSHRMTPMLPGNAAAWNVIAGGDSCTPCHTSRSRADLQADLDSWASSIAKATDDASSAVASARTRAASATVSGRLLLGAASTNLAYVASDGSKGAHDYPYAKSGLDKAAYFANAVGARYVRFSTTTYDVRTGLAFVYGQLALGNGSVRGDEVVTIEAKEGGSAEWVVVGTVRTTAKGDFALLVGPTVSTSYRARWTPLGGADLVSPVSAVTVPSSTTVCVSAASMPLGKYVTVSGTVAPPHPGATVTIQYHYGTYSWRTLSVRGLTASSAYAFAFKPSVRGTLSFRTVFGGDATHAASTSGVVTVRVY